MTVSREHLRPLDKLRLLEVLDENVELQDAFTRYLAINQLTALHRDNEVEREVARQRYLAIEDFRAHLAARKDEYRRQMEIDEADEKRRKASVA